MGSFSIIAGVVAIFILYKLFGGGGWATLIKKYKTKAIEMGFDGDEALDRLQLYWDYHNIPSMDGKKQFKEWMQPNGIQSDPHAYTVQVIWSITDDIKDGKYD